MKNLVRLTSILAFSLLGFAPAHAAQTNLVQSINIQLTAVLQGPAVTNGPIVTGTLTRQQITSKDVIQALGAATTNTFSTAAKLLAITPLPDGSAAFVVRDGTNNTDVSGFFTHDRTGTPTEKVRLNTRLNFATGTEFAFHNFGLKDADGFSALSKHFEVSGATMASFASLLNNKGKVLGAYYEYTAFVSGTGDINGQPAVLQGSISGKGRKIEVVQ